MTDSARTRKWLPATALALAAAVALLMYLAISAVNPTQASNPSPGAQINENSAPGASLGHPVSISSAGLSATYSLSGPDAGSFRIDPATGEVRLAEGVSPDFEAKPRYDVTVTVSAEVVITVNNLNEPGQVALSNDAPSAGDTITATLSDPDGGVTGASWAWSRGEDGNWNPIPGANGASYTAQGDDIGHRLRAEVSYDDDAGTANQASAATANPVRNDPPAFASSAVNRSVPEDAEDGTGVGAPVTATDPNGHDVRYSITGSSAFTVHETSGQISVSGEGALDHEAQAQHVLTLTATDPHQGQGSTTVTVNVANVEEPGAVSLSHGQLRRGTTVAAELTDPDGDISNVSWQWQRGQDDIAGATGSSYVAAPEDVGHRLSAEARYDDGHGAGKSARATTTVAVGNDAPVFDEATPQRSVDENAPAGTSVGAAVTATDPNGDTLTYSMDPGNFTIAQDGAVTTTRVLDHEAAASHTAQVTATDQHGAQVQVTLTVRVNNLDEPGTVSLDNDSPKVGDTLNASLSDPDGSASGAAWQWQNGDGANWTDISGATASAYTVKSSDLGRKLRASVAYSDPQGSGKTATSGATGAVSNDPPAFDSDGPVNITVDENNAPGATVGSALGASDPNNDTLTYSLEGADASSFSIDGNGQITATVILDHESKNSYAFQAEVSDPAGGTDHVNVNVSVNNVEEQGTVSLSPAGDPQAKQTITAVLNDPDGNIRDETWQWQSGPNASGPWTDLGGAASASYTPVEGDVDSHLRVTVSYTDGFGAEADAASATTTAVQPEPNHAPSFDDATTTFNISVNVREGVRVAPPFTATDLNGDTLTYSIAPDTPNSFTIDAETGEVLMGSLELAEGATYTATISVTDGLDGDRNPDTTADDTLDLTMTIVNPNVEITPASNHSFPNGLWVSDDLVVTTNSGSSEDWVLFYDRSTLVEIADRSFEIENPQFPKPMGVWSDGETLYVLVVNQGGGRDRIQAFSLENGNRINSKSFNLHNDNASPAGLTGHGGLLYVADNGDNKVYAYDPATKRRSSGNDIGGIDRLGKVMTDLWLNGTTVWISYWRSDFIRAYSVSDGSRLPGLDIQVAAENRGPTGIDSDGFNLWALDQVNDTVYGYVVPQ